VTGGLAYHGGPASGYLTHSIAAMVERLRTDPGELGLVSGVGMHMTKHVFGCYSTAARPLAPPAPMPKPEPAEVVGPHEGDAVVRAYSVVHGRSGDPEWAALVCELAEGRRVYARMDAERGAQAERDELVGTTVHLTPTTVEGPMGEQTVNECR
jgi:acetyl-CoA C-acetyltransferase